MKDILNFIELLFSENNIEKLLKTIISKTKEYIGADRGTLFLYNEEENILESIVLHGDNIQKIKLPIDTKSIAGYSFTKNQMLNIKDVYDEAELKNIDENINHDKKWDKLTGYRTKSILAIPINRGEKKLGVLELINKEPYFSKDDEEKAKLIAKFIGIALDNAIVSSKMLQKQKEEKTIIENIAEAVAITDLEMKILEVNSSFMEMVGFRYSFDEIEGNFLHKVLKELSQNLQEKTDKVKNHWIPEEIISELIKVKILPVITKEFNEEKLKKLVYIFKYPKG